MGKIRLGVIGAGSMTVGHHLPNLAGRLDEVDFVGVCRKGPQLLETIQRKFGFDMATEDYRELLDEGLDACIVASPTGLHHEHAMAAMASGAHVLLEKPMTITPQDAWSLVEQAEATKRHLLLAFGWNYRPMIVQAKQIMDAFGIGAVEHIQIHMASATRELLTNSGDYPGADPETVPDASTWTDPRLSGGGYGQAQLAHALGLGMYLTGVRATGAFALMSAPAGAPVELHDAISAQFEGGAIGTISGASCHLGANGNRHQLEVRVMGSSGQLNVDVERDQVWLYRRDGADVSLRLPDDSGLYDCVGPPNALVDLALGRPAVNRSPGELGARTVELLDAAYRSARTGRLEAVSCS